MDWLSITVFVYGLLMLLGGVGGFVSSKSVPSLIAGLISGPVLMYCAYNAKNDPKMSYGVAALATLVLALVFFRRYTETQKAMPSLGLMGLSLLVLVLLVVGHFMKGK